MILHGDTEQAVPPDASIASLSNIFLASLLGCLSLGAGEQQRSVATLMRSGNSLLLELDGYVNASRCSGS